MQTLLRLRALLLPLLLVGAAPASAGMLASASWIAPNALLPGAPLVMVPVMGTGTSTGTMVNVSLELPAFQATTILPTQVISVWAQLRLGGSAMITVSAGGAKADAAIPGSLSLRLAGVTRNGPVIRTPVVNVPLRVGLPGTHEQYFYVVGFVNYLTAKTYPWTVGTRIFTGLTLNRSPLPDVSAMGSFALTPGGAGTVTLVAPTRIQNTVYFDPGHAPRTLASFHRLTLHFVPEPDALLLAAAAGLALWRRARIG
jgi:hypothetical protein